MNNNKKLRNITKNINNKGVKREETQKQSYTEKFLSIAFWLLLSLIVFISFYFRFCSRKNIELKSSEIGFFVTLTLLFLIVFFVITIKGTGKSLYDQILSISSIILLITVCSSFLSLYIIIDMYFLYITLLLAFTSIWIAKNNLSNSKTVKFINPVIASFLAISSNANGFLWSVLKIKGKYQTLGLQIEGVEISYELIFKILMFPLFFMTVICSLYFTFKPSLLEDNKIIHK